jgi:hypothetical protein
VEVPPWREGLVYVCTVVVCTGGSKETRVEEEERLEEKNGIDKEDSGKDMEEGNERWKYEEQEEEVVTVGERE